MHRGRVLSEQFWTLTYRKLILTSTFLFFISAIEGPTRGGYWIPFSCEKIGHILKSRENFSIFPIMNFHPRHPVEYFCSRLRALFKTVIIEQLPKKLHKDMILYSA